MPLSLSKQRLDLEKRTYELTKASEKLEKLKRDAALLTVTAPEDGLIYYGAFENGEWTGSSSMADKLKRGGSLSAHEVFMTIVALRPLGVQTSVPEKELHRVVAGAACRVTPNGDPSCHLPARIERVAAVPGADEKFAAVVKLSDDSPAGGKLKIVPGMKCSIQAIVCDKPDAIAIPLHALHSDEFDDQKQFVYLADAQGHHARRDVKIGDQNEKTVEIVSGLASGDKILLDDPHDD